MNKLKTLAISVFALCAASTVSLADSSDFAGPYVGLQIGAAGVELDGKNTDGNGNITKGKGGVVSEMAGIDAGYAFPLSENFVMAVGVSYIPIEGEIFGTQDGSQSDAGNDSDTADDPTTVTVDIGDHYTVYLQPTLTLSDTAAVFAKIGYSEAEVNVAGQSLAQRPGDLEGTTISFGTKVNMANGMYMQTEAGMTDYDNIKATGTDTGNSGGNSGLSGSVEADPNMAYGIVTIGMQF